MFKAQLQEENGLWHDVRGADGNPLLFESNAEAHARLAEMFPVVVKMEHYTNQKRTRVYEVIRDDNDD